MAEKKQNESLIVQNMGVGSKKNIFEGKIQYLPLDQLEDFKNHPFKVEMNTELFELMQSIEKEGVLVPLLARPNPEGQGYELIAGHRRKVASKWAGVDKVPVMVLELDDCQAVITMVDSNLQREHIKPSEKAFAYRMKLEAMKQQGKRTDLTLSQVGTKSVDNPTLSVEKVVADYDESGKWKLQNESSKIRVDEILARQVGESRNQIARYIRLTYLIPKILDWVDEGKIAFTVAVELSYLNEEEQYAVKGRVESCRAGDWRQWRWKDKNRIILCDTGFRQVLQLYHRYAVYTDISRIVLSGRLCLRRQAASSCDIHVR